MGRVFMVKLTSQIFGAGHKPYEPVGPVKNYHYDIGSLQDM